MRPIDKHGQEIKNGDIIDINETVNGCRYFVVVDLDKLDVRYYDNNHQGVGFGDWVAIDRKYQYDVEELLNMKPDPNWGFIESELEIVGSLTEEELVQTQIGSRSGVDEPKILKEYHIVFSHPGLSYRDMFIQAVTEEEALEIAKRGYTEEQINEGCFDVRRSKDINTKYTLDLVNPNDIPHRNNCIIRLGCDLTEEELKICEDALNKHLGYVKK